MADAPVTWLSLYLLASGVLYGAALVLSLALSKELSHNPWFRLFWPVTFAAMVLWTAVTLFLLPGDLK